MYLSTPLGKVIALDPVTGKQRWMRDVGVKRDRHFGDWVSRGVSYWRDSRAKAGSRARAGSSSAPSTRAWSRWMRPTGEFCPDFGKGGEINLVPLLAQQTILRRRIRADVAAGRHRRSHRRRLRHRGQQLHRGRDRRSARASMRAPARCAGRGIPCRRIRPIPLTRPGRAKPRIAPAAPTPGPSSPPIPRAISCSCRPPVPPSTTTASRGSATTATRTPWSRCAPRPEKWSGTSRPCITTCGTTTMRRRRR